MTERSERLTKATRKAYNVLIDATGGNSAEVSSCAATLFVEVMRMCGVPDKDALAALKSTFELMPRHTGH